MKGWSRSPSPSDARDFARWSSGENVQSIEEEGGDDNYDNVEGNDDHEFMMKAMMIMMMMLMAIMTQMNSGSFDRG